MGEGKEAAGVLTGRGLQASCLQDDVVRLLGDERRPLAVALVRELVEHLDTARGGSENVRKEAAGRTHRGRNWLRNARLGEGLHGVLVKVGDSDTSGELHEGRVRATVL